jgi:hypothetical protein
MAVPKLVPGYEFTDDGPRPRAITVVIPESVWDDFLSPDCSGMEAELGLTELRADPFYRRRGTGGQRVYENVLRADALELAEYLYDRGDMLLGQDYSTDDASTRDAYRRAVKLAEQIREDAR